MAKGGLQRKKKVVSGTLLNSIAYKIDKKQEGDFTISFLSAPDGAFVDEGVRGGKKVQTFVDFGGNRRPSSFRFGSGSGVKGGLTKGLDQWVIKRGIAGRDEKGRFLSRKSLKFLIARKIFTFGIESTSFYSKPLKLQLKFLPEDVMDQFETAIMDTLITNK